ncbi:hypothetical protein DUNSADRAFT_13705 [Dunaliella salina]|uniref:DUF819 domain-containing protein n=1 Tax=Dunaliella salina TaxID=3046 RepID=A0ABQ7H352_DUNSA|nr:hypothetical protein DUNSADRAFT_13705 [Dunaliella salina]|eukprot:KAF5841251.1 hypothetical protein DUNSADRAFT_13705 [Dunaliella salina]
MLPVEWKHILGPCAPRTPSGCSKLGVSKTQGTRCFRCSTGHASSGHQAHQWLYASMKSRRRAQRLTVPAALPAAEGTSAVLASMSSNAPGAAVSGASLFPVGGPWGVWACLILAGTFGLWSERTRLGKELSGALVATLSGMLLANIGVLPPGPKEMHVVYKFLLPLAIPMLLFSADLRRVLTETGRLLLAFLLGAAATVAGSYAAMLLFPLAPWLGDAGWRMASALTARHIGGAVNYMAVSETLSIPPSVFGAGLAADDLILTIYFAALYTLAKSVPPDSESAPEKEGQKGAQDIVRARSVSKDPEAEGGGPKAQAGGGGHSGGTSAKKGIQILEGLTALTISAVICHIATCLAGALGAPGQSITIITALTVMLATAAPKALAPLVGSAEGLAQILMQVFYATIGASANIALVVTTAPVLFLFSFIALAGHLGFLLGVGSLLGFSRRELLVASNANIGGPSTVAGMAAAKGWTSSIVPGILTSTLGYALGSFLGIGMGHTFFK